MSGGASGGALAYAQQALLARILRQQTDVILL